MSLKVQSKLLSVGVMTAVDRRVDRVVVMVCGNKSSGMTSGSRVRAAGTLKECVVLSRNVRTKTTLWAMRLAVSLTVSDNVTNVRSDR